MVRRSTQREKERRYLSIATKKTEHLREHLRKAARRASVRRKPDDARRCKLEKSQAHQPEIKLAEDLLEELEAGLRRKRARLKHQWGLTDLPEGIAPGTLELQNDALCAVLCLQDGTKVHGPLRLRRAEAEADLEAFSSIQQADGDEAAVAEMQRLDVEAMTDHFACQLRPIEK